MKTSMLAVLLLVLGGLAALESRVDREVEAPLEARELEALPLRMEARRDVEISEDALSVLGVDAHRFVELDLMGAAPLWLYAGYYGAQRRNAQIHAPEHCYPGTGFEVEISRRHRVGEGFVRELHVHRQGQRRLVWYRYRTRSGDSFGPYGLKWDMMLAALRGRPRDAMLVRLSTPWLSIEDVEGPRARLALAWGESVEDLQQWFAQGEQP